MPMHGYVHWQDTESDYDETEGKPDINVHGESRQDVKQLKKHHWDERAGSPLLTRKSIK